MARSRRLQRDSSGSSDSSSSTSPERGRDDDNDSFMMQANDSQSSIGADISPELSQDAELRRIYEETCRVSPVHRLPAELLISIFSRLSAPKDLQNCMLVSKEWAKNSVGLLWHRPAMNKWESIHSVVQSIRKANKFFAYQDLVKRLNMSTLSVQVSDGTLLGMAPCKRIERLTLTNCSKLTDVGLQPLVTGNRVLLALDVTGLDQLTDLTMMTVADTSLRLQGLNVSGCKKLTDASISAMAKSCRHLKRLKFNNCVQLTDTSIMTIAGVQRPSARNRSIRPTKPGEPCCDCAPHFLPSPARNATRPLHPHQRLCLPRHSHGSRLANHVRISQDSGSHGLFRSW